MSESEGDMDGWMDGWMDGGREGGNGERRKKGGRGCEGMKEG